MRTQMLASVVLASSLVFGFGCGGDTDTSDTGGNGGTTAAKSDCPDCDPAGPNAFIQTGVGDGFYEVGDTWQVAFRYVHTPMAERRDDVFLADDVADSEVYLFDYVVRSLGRDVFDNVQRDTAVLEITQATPTGVNADLFSPERVDRYEHKIVFEMNDLLEPTYEIYYNKNYPHGKRTRLDTRSSLKQGASIFPRTVPRLLVEGAVEAPAPTLPADLADVVDAYGVGWRDATYKRYTFDNGDIVYWAQSSGKYWPFYVRTSQGVGVLVKWN